LGEIRDWYITPGARAAIAERTCQHTGNEDELSMCGKCYSMSIN
jgi:hypothetical protein